MSMFSPSSTAAAPWEASAESGWASSHLLQAHSQASSPVLGAMSGFAVLVPAGSATSTRKPLSGSVWQGA